MTTILTTESGKYVALIRSIYKDKRVLAKVIDVLQHLDKISPYL